MRSRYTGRRRDVGVQAPFNSIASSLTKYWSYRMRLVIVINHLSRRIAAGLLKLLRRHSTYCDSRSMSTWFFQAQRIPRLQHTSQQSRSDIPIETSITFSGWIGPVSTNFTKIIFDFKVLSIWQIFCPMAPKIYYFKLEAPRK